MIPLPVGQVADIVDGRLAGVSAQAVVSEVAFDSRSVREGALFVAVRGARVDGHHFVDDAVAHGAVCAVVDHECRGAAGAALPCIVVDDPVAALGRLAAWVRREVLTCTVVAVTGSSGKTTTKDLIAGLLDRAGVTVRAASSFNTEVGLPVTVLAADAHTRFLVLEMGMRGPGHIRYLADLAHPDIAVVVNVGSAHLGVVGSREAIVDAKAELVEALAPDGLAVLLADDPAVASMSTRTRARTVGFGRSATADVRAVDVHLDAGARATFTIVAGDERAEVSLRLVGDHQVDNALAASAVALACGLDLATVAETLGELEPAGRWRMEVRESAAGVTVVNDAFNANPESVRAALKALAAMGAVGRTWAVLGEMRELGDVAEGEHEAVGRLAVQLGIERIVSVGPGTEAIDRGAAGAGAEAVHVADADAAVALLRSSARPGDVVLVKASRSVGLERVAGALLASSAPSPKADAS